MTKAEIKASTQDQIQNAGTAEVLEMLRFLYKRQTKDEQKFGGTINQNSRGFNSLDATILTDICERAEQFGSLTEAQAALVRKKLMKYWSQLHDYFEPPDERP